MKLNQEEMDVLNSITIIKEIKFATKNLPKKESPYLHDFTGEFYAILMKKLARIIHNFSQKIKENRTLHNLFYEVSIILRLKPGRKVQKKKEKDKKIKMKTTDQ